MAASNGLSGRQKLGWTVVTVLVLLYALFPVIAIFANSFKTQADLGNPTFWPSNWTWANYEMIFFGGPRSCSSPPCAIPWASP